MHGGLHAILAYGVTGLLLAGGLVMFLARRDMRWRTVGRRMTITAVLAVIPVATTGMLAQRERIWAAADVEDVPENLPWYRLTRDADSVNGCAVRWHSWLGAVTTALVIISIFLSQAMSRRLGAKKIAVGATLLTLAFTVSIVSGLLIRRADGRTGSRETPAWGNGSWDDPSASAGSDVRMLRVHMLLLGAATSAAVATIALSGTSAARRRLKLGTTIAISLLTLTIGVSLWTTTGWQFSRIAALMVQPRDAACLVTSVAAIVAMVVLVWFHAREWRRATVAAAWIVSFLLLAQLWLAALILYDGSYRGSPIWRFHRPFIQRPS